MTTIKVRRGTATQWASAATVLAAGEPGLDTTNNILKLGDGSTAWASLSPVLDGTYATRAWGDPTALATFHSALASVTTAPVDVLHIGDSITWGLKAGTLAARWPSVLRDTLRASYPSGATGGFGYMGPVQTYGSDTFSDATAVLTAGATSSSAFSLDQSGFNLSTGGDKVVYTFTGTGIDFFYATYGGGGTFSYKIDAGSTTNINTNGTLAYNVRNQSIRGLSAASHTLTIQYVSGGLIFTSGAFAYNGDEAKGVRSWVAAWPGSDSFYWADPAHQQWIDQVAWAQPALVTIELGPNDKGNNITPATYKSQTQSIISSIKAVCTTTPSFVLIPVWPLGTGTNTYWWQDYVDVMYTIAAQDADSAVCIDDWMAITSAVYLDTTLNGLMASDHGHPSAAGNPMFGRHLAAFVSPH